MRIARDRQNRRYLIGRTIGGQRLCVRRDCTEPAEFLVDYARYMVGDALCWAHASGQASRWWVANVREGIGSLYGGSVLWGGA